MKKGKAEVKFANLLDHREAIPQIAEWFYLEWGCQIEGNSVEKTIRKIEKRMNRDEIPLIELALMDDEIVATGSLKLYEMSIYPELPNWL